MLTVSYPSVMQCQLMYKPESTERGGGGGGTGDKGPGGAIVPVDVGQLASVDGLRWSCRAARWPFWREFGGRSVGRMAGQWQTGCGQAGNGRARNRGRASLNSASQDQRCGRCKVQAARRAGEPSVNGEEAPPEGPWWSLPVRPDRAAPASERGYAPSPGRPACGICVPWASWRIPAWADSHNDYYANQHGYQLGINKEEDDGGWMPEKGLPMRCSESSQRRWSGYLECRGRIHQDTLCNGISGTFDSSQPLALGNGFIKAMRARGVCLHDNGGMVPTMRRNVWITPS